MKAVFIVTSVEIQKELVETRYRIFEKLTVPVPVSATLLLITVRFKGSISFSKIIVFTVYRKLLF